MKTTPTATTRRYKVFVSYRHADNHVVARIVEFLIAVFGKEAVFHDTSSIAAGQDFRVALQSAVEESEMVLAIIGPTWIESFGERRQSARPDAPDWVVVELEWAFSKGIRVVPAVIYPAGMPSRDSIPAEIGELAFRQARIIWPDLAFENSVHQLVDEIQVILDGDEIGKRSVTPPKSRDRKATPVSPPSPRWRWFMGAATLLVLGLAIWQNFLRHSPLPTTDSIDSNRIAPSEAEKSQLDRRIRTIRTRAPSPVRERSNQSIESPSLGTPDFSPFEVLEDEILWDLRGVKQLQKDDPPFTSYAIMTRRVRFTKIAEVKEIRFEARTTGTDLFLRCPSHPLLSIEYVSKSEKFTGEQAMKVRQIVVDLAEIPQGVETAVEIEGTYWDSLQRPEDRWVGAAGYSNSDIIRLFVMFPEHQPFLSWRLLTAPTRRDPPTPYQGRCRFLADPENGYLFWEVPFVEAEHVYRLEWEW